MKKNQITKSQFVSSS